MTVSIFRVIPFSLGLFQGIETWFPLTTLFPPSQPVFSFIFVKHTSGNGNTDSVPVVIRNMIAYYKVGLDNGTQPAYVSSSAVVDVRANHSSIVRTNGAASLVLLKNTNNALPLEKPLSMALFGNHAGPIMAGPNYVFSIAGAPSTYGGHLAGGSGSGQTSFPYLITPQQALTNRASMEGTMIRWILNNTYTATIDSGISTGGGGGFGGDMSGNSTGNSTGSGGGGGIAGLSGGTSITQTIPDYATNAAVCIAFINAFSGEGADRTEVSVLQNFSTILGCLDTLTSLE